MQGNCFGKNLKALRIEEGLSQRDLGDNLGFSNQTISFWESGSREPDLDTLLKIAKYFGVSVDALLKE